MQLPFTVNSHRRTGFTLVELLVVIGIIALLIAMLLPSLIKVRRQAAALKCTSNMRQVATAVLQYGFDYNGALVPTYIPAVAAGDPARTVYPDGLWFATELVRRKYISAPNVYPAPAGPRVFDGSSVFRCPEGIDEAFSAGGGAGAYPTALVNNAYCLPNATKEQELGFGIASWYMLNTGVNTNSNRLQVNPKTATPFVTYTVNNTSGGSPFTDAQLLTELRNTNFQRKTTMMRRSGEMVMIVEAASTNWSYGAGIPPADLTNQVPRLGARHGQRTQDGKNAYTNIAFFDGHVANYPTLPLSTKGILGLSTGTIFFVGMAR